ncbi:FAD-dependent oxidoreductase [Nocardia otitidiscaviarum]|uniref:FAD-dependent oxidoreductase n=1 Tax=Nocardia otitidiscaviarum TaxID=1823 RepID=UPI002B4B2033|nr:FAD-dependent oxidoreductase [Nocardia otitidiscaviarum]
MLELARRAGLPVARGVLVDDRMCTAAPGVYAAGDVAEHRGRVHGLWPIAAEQAEVAAVNALGGHRTLHAETPATILKGVGLELFTAGRVRPEPGDEVIVSDDPRRRSYRRLVVAHGRVVGATVLGHHPAEVAGVQRALRATEPLSSGALAAARVGDWAALAPG